jgi:hypothetical protein
VTWIALESTASVAASKGLDSDAVEVAVAAPGGATLSAVVARRVAVRAGTLAESLVAASDAPGFAASEDGLSIVVPGVPEDYPLPKAVERDGDAFRFAGATRDDPYVVPGPADFPDVLPGSSGPLASAVQLFVGLPMTGYLSVDEGEAVAYVNEALGLDHVPTYSTATAEALAAELTRKRPTRRSK